MHLWANYQLITLEMRLTKQVQIPDETVCIHFTLILLGKMKIWVKQQGSLDCLDLAVNQSRRNLNSKL